MKQTFKITGMTCGNCKAKVENVLQSLPEVNGVEVNLEEGAATLVVSKALSVEDLQRVLPEKYSVSKLKEQLLVTHKEELNENVFKQLFPLFLIFGYILVAAVLMNSNPWQTNEFMLDFMGLFYVVFSFFKFLDLKGFANSFPMYDPLAKQISGYAWVYPFIELALGILFLMRIQIWWGLIITIVILGVTTIGVTRVLLNKQTIQCACLGTVLKLPMTKATFIENAIMIIMAVLMLISYF